MVRAQVARVLKINHAQEYSHYTCHQRTLTVPFFFWYARKVRACKRWRKTFVWEDDRLIGASMGADSVQGADVLLVHVVPLCAHLTQSGAYVQREVQQPGERQLVGAE